METGFVENIEALAAGDEFGEQVHTESDQFGRAESGAGEVWMNDRQLRPAESS